jgi:hypothetical protein
VTIAMIHLGGDSLGLWHLVPGLALGGLGFGLVAPIAAGVAVIGAIFTTLLGDGRGFDDAASASLWYAVAAFALGFACSFALPAHARAPHDVSTTTG